MAGIYVSPISYASAGYCPATSNAPTRMTEAGFRRRCARHMEENDYCSGVCRGGHLPAGLEFIEIKNLQLEEHEMAPTKKTICTCEICGQPGKNCHSVRGKQCCASCEFLWRGALNSPTMLLQCIEEAQGGKWLEEKVGVAGSQTLQAELDAQRLATEAALRENEHLKENIAVKQSWQKSVITELGLDPVGSFSLPDEIAKLVAENARLREQIAGATDEIDCRSLICETGGGISNRDSAILDILFDFVDGKITGLDVALLRELR